LLTMQLQPQIPHAERRFVFICTRHAFFAQYLTPNLFVTRNLSHSGQPPRYENVPSSGAEIRWP
jgi:hypothetical protein